MLKIFGLAAAIYCLPIAAEAENQNPLSEVTIAEYGEYPLYTVLYVADAKGMFAEQNLKVKIVPAGGDEKVFAALLAGDAQFGVSDPTFVAISGERGQPGVVVGSILCGVPAWGVARDPKVPQIERPEQLRGFRIAAYPPPSTSYTIQKRMMQQGGVSPNIVPIQYGALLAALESGRVDIALENEPNVALAEQQGARRVYYAGEKYRGFAFTGLMVLPEYLKQHPETVQAVVTALQRAMNLLHSKPEEALKVLTERFPELGETVLRSALNNVMREKIFPVDGIVSRAGWDAAVSLRREVKDLKQDASYEQYVVTQFAEKAKLAQ